MTRLDLFRDDDEPNLFAFLLFRMMRSQHYTPDEIVCAAVYLANEMVNDLIDCTKELLKYTLCVAFGEPIGD